MSRILIFHKNTMAAILGTVKHSVSYILEVNFHTKFIDFSNKTQGDFFNERDILMKNVWVPLRKLEDYLVSVRQV